MSKNRKNIVWWLEFLRAIIAAVSGALSGTLL